MGSRGKTKENLSLVTNIVIRLLFTNKQRTKFIKKILNIIITITITITIKNP